MTVKFVLVDHRFPSLSSTTYILCSNTARLDELNRDYNSREQERIKKGGKGTPDVQKLGFSIDDIVGADEASCSRFKNDQFVENKVVWSQSLRASVKKFLTLSK